jgi:hypothetical protein
MDLTRAIRYRGRDLNLVKFDEVTRNMTGCEVTRVSYHGVQGVGYDEKKALADGFDAGDVWMGKRIISMSGNVYGRTRAEAMNLIMALVETLTPTQAYNSNKGARGFVPLDFYMPTDQTMTTHFPSGLIHLMMLARPVAQPSIEFASDVHGGTDTDALSIAWQVTLECRQPYIFNSDFITHDMSAKHSGSGSFRNRGNIPAPFEVRVIVPAAFNGTATGRWTLHGYSEMAFTVPYSTGNQTFAYDTYAKVLAVNGKLRMDLLVFGTGHTHGRLNPGVSSFSWNKVGSKALMAGSFIRFRDTWA